MEVVACDPSELTTLLVGILLGTVELQQRSSRLLHIDLRHKVDLMVAEWYVIYLTAACITDRLGLLAGHAADATVNQFEFQLTSHACQRREL